jgi:hypothetical protein
MKNIYDLPVGERKEAFLKLLQEIPYEDNNEEITNLRLKAVKDFRYGCEEEYIMELVERRIKLNELVIYIESEKGLSIESFFKSLIREKEFATVNVVGVFNDHIYKVFEDTTMSDLLYQFGKNTR